MNLCVVGVGYVGLVAGICLAESGNEVICSDKDKEKIEMLKNGTPSFYEPGLEELIARNIKEKRLSFTEDLVNAIRASEIIFIAVGTPPAEDGSADLSAVFDVARVIAKNLNSYKIVVLKSTVPVGTADRVEEIIHAETEGEFDVVSNPEFMKEGAAVEDFMRPDRIVIGARNERAARIMQELYAPYVRTEKPILLMDRRSAEMTKYAANAMLATKISFINEMANICEKVGADINNVRRGIGFDSRIGFQFLFPGVGYGGSCFPKDVDALIRTAAEHDYESKVLSAVQSVNQSQKQLMVQRIKKHFEGRLKGLNLAMWGLSFKPQTDDMRAAPSLEIIQGLLPEGVVFQVYDPVAMNEAKKILGDSVRYMESAYAALEGASALVAVTEWPEFRRPNFVRIKELLKEPVIFDGRNLYEPDLMQARGFVYYSIGREPAGKTS
jgi:UDPglucose 6-dehydrogenase